MKLTMIILVVSLLSGCMTPQQRADQEAGRRAAIQGKLAAQQALEAIQGINPSR